MKSLLIMVPGVLAVAVGVVWTLQGLGLLGGSAMTGERLWAVIGPIVALAGLMLVATGLRARRRQAAPADPGSE
jgi:hypothetical protein